MISVHVYRHRGKTKEAAALALRHRLYTPGRDWLLRQSLQFAASRGTRAISLVLKDDVPIAVALDEGLDQLQVFVRKAERRNGYGTMAVKALPRTPASYGDEGLYGTAGFWESVGIPTGSQRTSR